MDKEKQIKEKQDLYVKNYKLQRVISEGKQEKIYFSPPHFIVKQISLTSDSKQTEQHIKRDIAIFQEINHKNVLHCYQSFQQGKNLYIVTNYQETNLQNYLNNYYSNQKRKFEQKDLIRIFIQICEGLKYLHSMNIMHRVINQSNILINSKGQAVITNFGFSSRIILPDFQSYQIKLDKQYSKTTDIWLLGIMYFSILKWVTQNQKPKIIEPTIYTKKIKQQSIQYERVDIIYYKPRNLLFFSKFLFHAMLNKDQNERISWQKLFGYVFNRQIQQQLEIEMSVQVTKRRQLARQIRQREIRSIIRQKKQRLQKIENEKKRQFQMQRQKKKQNQKSLSFFSKMKSIVSNTCFCSKKTI